MAKPYFSLGFSSKLIIKQNVWKAYKYKSLQTTDVDSTL